MLPANSTFFTGPKVDAAYGFSVNFFDAVATLRSPLGPATGSGLSTARTYYWLIKDLGGFPPPSPRLATAACRWPGRAADQAGLTPSGDAFPILGVRALLGARD